MLQHGLSQSVSCVLYAIALVTCGLLVADAQTTTLPAFPGAEGAGSTTPGGRGGTVLSVTNLDDAGPGSLRAACEAKGPRIVVFRTGGLIELKSPLRIEEPFITIAGQSAPGGGICFKGYGCVIATHDVVIRHVRFRPGDISGKEQDALGIVNSRNVVIDHCSASWGTDETLSVTGDSRDVTVQWCVISESLNHSIHHKGAHGYGSLLRAHDGTFTFHHNLYAHHNSRNPRPGGYPDKPGLLLDFRNNAIYDWGGKAGYNADDVMRMNYVANYLKPGVSTKDNERSVAFSIGGTGTKIYASKNVIEGYPTVTGYNLYLLRFPENIERQALREMMLSTPFDTPTIREETAEAAYKRIVTEAGATLPVRDGVDARVLEDVRLGRGTIIDSQTAVGAWPEYERGSQQTDTEEDGIPDVWEQDHGLDSKNPNDAQKDTDKDGYTNIEEFLNNSDPASGN
ncbi:MAG: pectate lyase [Candidatus Hydrogenedentes bacterium]|nr:pectate lyase [Candidatus Hydrogenedentota bacterium]